MIILLRIWYTNGEYEEKEITEEQQKNGYQISRENIETMILDCVW